MSKSFVIVEPCVVPFKDSRKAVAMRFVPRELRDYFLARCFTRYLKEKRKLGLPRTEAYRGLLHCKGVIYYIDGVSLGVGNRGVIYILYMLLY